MAELQKTKFRGKEVITIEGDVTGFYVNPIPEDKIKSYPTAKGLWTPTHRYNLVVGEYRISLGMGDKDGVSDRQQIRVKDNDGVYHNLVRGLKVSVEVKENGEYQGKTQYQASNSNVIVLDATNAQGTAQGSTGGQKAAGGASGGSYKPKDMTGVSVGHSFNGAMNFLLTQGVEASNENIAKYGTSVHNVTEKVKAQFAKANPDKSEYDVGAAVGNSILNAAKLVDPDGDFESQLEALSSDFLTSVVPVLEKHVREGKGAAVAPKVTRAAPKKSGVTKAKPAAQREEPVDDKPSTGFDDMDDDIPF